MWVEELGIELGLAMDPLSALALTLVWAATATITAWVLRTRPSEHRRLTALLLVFAGAMSVLVTAADLFTLFVAWEVTSGLSYLLVGFDRGRAATRAARTTLVVTGLGGVALLTAAVLLHVAGADLALTALAASDTGDARVVAAAWLVLLAAATKSAQWPFHGWLTGAGTAPAAASALLHAATLVIAGVYLVARLAPTFAAVPGWTAAGVAVGLTTFVWAHVVAARAVAAKSLLAATTAAQMGLALACAATGTAAGIGAAMALLVVHGAYKAALFLAAGHVATATGRKDVAALWPASAGSRAVRATLVLGAVALAGIPPLAGWATKEAAVAVLGAWAPAAGVTVGVGAALGVVAAGHLVGLTGRPAATGPGRFGAGTLLPLVLVLPAVVLGVWTTPLATAATAAAVTVADGTPAKVVLVPSPGSALTISLAGLAVGALGVLAARRSGDRVGLERPVRAPALLATGLDAALGAATTLAGRVEALSRPAVVGTVAGAAFGSLLLLADPGAIAWSRIPLVGSPAEALAGSTLLAGTVGVLVTRTRLAAALMLGVVGFSLAAVFALRAAPDLVLTQVVVETVVVVAFVGVLLRLAPRLERRGTPPDLDGWLARGLVAVTAAGVAGDLALQLASAPAPRPLAASVLDAAQPVGRGANAVNVVLTDFRALDTAGEVAVLFLAAVGILALVRSTEGRDELAARPVSSVVARAVPTITRLAVVVSLHLLAVGHDQPGGGFVGGLVLGAGVALHRLGTGRLPAPRLTARPDVVLSGGLVVASGALLAPLAVGLPFADMGATTLDLGVLGQPKLTTAFAFDVGVLLVVLGLVLAVLRTVADASDHDVPAAPDAAPTPARGAGRPRGRHDQPTPASTSGVRP